MTAALEQHADAAADDIAVQRRLAAAAIDAMAVSADGFALLEHFDEAVAALDEGDPAKATSDLAQRIVGIDSELTQLASTDGRFEELRAETRRAVTIGRETLADPRAIDIIASDPLHHLTIYLAHGVIPYRPLAHGMARASLVVAVAACGKDSQAAELPDTMVEYAGALLDKTDELAAEGRDATRLGDLLSAVHEALPLYVAAQELLRWARQLVQARGEEPDPDTGVELRVVEEFRLACIECVTSAFASVVGQVVNLAFLGTSGEPLRDVARTAVRQASDRLPFMPSSLRAGWSDLAAGIPASVTVPYGDASADLAGRLTRALWEVFDRTFEDRLVVDVTRSGRRRSVPFMAYDDGELSAWDDTIVASRPDEQRAALRKGQAWLEHGEPQRAARAFAAAQRADDRPTRESATVFLGIARMRMGDSAAAETSFRAALNAEELVTESAARLNLGALLGAQRRYAEAESILDCSVFRAGRPGHGMAMAMLAVARGELGDEPGADAAWSEALTSGDEDAVELIAALSGDSGIRAQAVARLEQVISTLVQRDDSAAARRILDAALERNVMAGDHVDALRAAVDARDAPSRPARNGSG